ncbi:hypothetical protein HYX17_02600 [Candidatus Woesearchaeota archaeon]|nr:hypothetical protein [Candidatus Woesearchaeota archaeon]
MTELNIHCEESKKRTGKEYRELHMWIDEPQKYLGKDHRKERHDPNNKEDSTFIFSKWSTEGYIEWLIHIIDDYKDTGKKLEMWYKVAMHKKNEVSEELDKSRKGYEAVEESLRKIIDKL